MAIRQYIGARYVLKIYENSLNPLSADWEANTSYEPLTMVNFNNSSYISRKYVPANIGNPVDNPTYWALSGLYNGQIAALQQQINEHTTEIQAINDELDIVTNRTIVISDSYGMNVPGNFIDKMQSYDSDIIGSAVGGSSFIQSTTYPEIKNFYRQLTETVIPYMETNNIDKKSIKYVIVAGGYNDGHYSRTTANINLVVAKMQEFTAKVKEEFPNATPLLAFLGWQLHSENTTYDLEDQIQGYLLYKVYGATAGFGFIENSETNLFATGMIDSSDPFHPTAAAGTSIAIFLLNAIRYGATDVVDKSVSPLNTVLTPASGITISSGSLAVEQINRKISLRALGSHNGMVFEFTTPVNLNQYSDYTLGTFDETFGCFNRIYKVTPTTVFIVDSSDNSFAITCSMGIKDRDLILNLNFNPAIPNASKIYVQNFSIEYDPYYDSNPNMI